MHRFCLFYVELFIYPLLSLSAVTREKKCGSSIGLFSYACGIPRNTWWTSHSEEDVVSSHVAVPPMICIVIFTHNCDLSIPSHNYINSRGGVHKSILKKNSHHLDCRPKIFDLIF